MSSLFSLITILIESRFSRKILFEFKNQLIGMISIKFYIYSINTYIYVFIILDKFINFKISHFTLLIHIILRKARKEFITKSMFLECKYILKSYLFINFQISQLFLNINQVSKSWLDYLFSKNKKIILLE